VQRALAATQILIVVSGVFATIFALDRLGIALAQIHHGARFSASTTLVLHVVLLASISVALAFAALRSDRIASLGLSRQPLSRVAFFTLLGGCGTFAVNAIVVVTFIALSGGFAHEADIAREKAAALKTLGEIPVWLMVPLAIVAGIYEEIVFRGFLLGRLRVLLATRRAIAGDAMAVVLSSVIFGLGHAYQGALGVAQTTFAGLCLALLAVVSRSLYPSILTHAGIDSVSLLVLHFLSPMVDSLLKDIRP